MIKPLHLDTTYVHFFVSLISNSCSVSSHRGESAAELAPAASVGSKILRLEADSDADASPDADLGLRLRLKRWSNRYGDTTGGRGGHDGRTVRGLRLGHL